MSASEKMKALDAEIRSDEPFEIIRTELATGALAAALPQIVAVVEAAEQFGEEYWNSDYTHVADALTALEDALQ